MGVRILIGHEQGGDILSEQAVLFDSTTGWTFGPVFSAEDGTSAEDHAVAFFSWFSKMNGTLHECSDIRQLSPRELEELYGTWLRS
jgi:hypothetical protein